MTAGMLIRNDQNTLIIDGIHPLSVFIPCTASQVNLGALSTSGETTLYKMMLTLTYDFPVSGSTPPLIVARHDLYPAHRYKEGSNPADGFNYRNFMATHTKDPQGRYVSVQLRWIEYTTGGGTAKDFRGYFCPLYWGAHGPLPDYGMFIRSASGEIVFNPNTPIAQLIGHSAGWYTWDSDPNYGVSYTTTVPAPIAGQWFLYSPPVQYNTLGSGGPGSSGPYSGGWGSFAFARSAGRLLVMGYSTEAVATGYNRNPPDQWPAMVVAPFGGQLTGLKIG